MSDLMREISAAMACCEDSETVIGATTRVMLRETLRRSADEIERLHGRLEAAEQAAGTLQRKLNKTEKDMEMALREFEELSYEYRRRTAASIVSDGGQALACSANVAAAYGSLRAQRDALQADAERYRWLRNSFNLGKGHARIWKQDIAQAVVMANEELDAAIDAALGKDGRSCTCHPDDKPPVPCPKKYALSECRKAALGNGGTNEA